MSNNSESSVSSNSKNDSADSDPPQEVRVYKPKAILLGFHGVVSPINWEEDCILPYVIANLGPYVNHNWTDRTVISLVNKLRKQSFDEHFVLENEDSPLISEEDPNDPEDQMVKKTVIEFIKWQIDRHKDSNEGLHLQRLVWNEGYDKKKLKTPVFDDVLAALKAFKKDNIKIAIFSFVSSALCHQLFANTTAGDLTPYFHQFFDTEFGDRKDAESYRKIAKQLNLSQTDLLYIIDYGQEAKIAHQTGLHCLLIQRPGNRRIREYYLINFSSIQSLKQMRFVNKN